MSKESFLVQNFLNKNLYSSLHVYINKENPSKLKLLISEVAMSEEKITPYDLITNELVCQALHNDVGPLAKLLSWESKDFTKEGDNYSSKVTSVLVMISTLYFTHFLLILY